MQTSLLRTDKEITEIYNRHMKTVYRVCFLFMKNIPDTEDIVQNTFIRLMRDTTVFESTEHEKAWLIRTAGNLCKDTLKHWWSKTVNLETAEDKPSECRFEIDETLQKVLNLPPKIKATVYLYYYEGYTTVEIAKMLHKNKATIRSDLFKGRKYLKMELEGDYT